MSFLALLVADKCHIAIAVVPIIDIGYVPQLLILRQYSEK